MSGSKKSVVVKVAEADEMRGHLQAIELVALAVESLFAMFVYHYVTRLERIGCTCAMDGWRTYIQWYALGIFMVVIVKLAIMLSGSQQAYRMFSLIVAPVTLVFTVVYVVYVIRYINRLRREKCACSATVSRATIYVIAIIEAVLMAIVGLGVLAAVVAVRVGKSEG